MVPHLGPTTNDVVVWIPQFLTCQWWYPHVGPTTNDVAEVGRTMMTWHLVLTTNDVTVFVVIGPLSVAISI